jgi:hypothetical protein
MAEPKTKETAQSVTAFLDKVPDKIRRDDSRTVAKIMQAVTKEEPRMWGSSIVGFGRRRYEYSGGREGEWMIIGFSPRQTNITLYIPGGLDKFPDLLKDLGKYKTAKSCLYIKKLSDVDLDVLTKLVKKSIATVASKRIRR